MTHTEELDYLLRELERVGVDPNTISAGLAVHPADALRVLAALPDGAGPAAFLAQLRQFAPHHDGRDAHAANDGPSPSDAR